MQTLYLDIDQTRRRILHAIGDDQTTLGVTSHRMQPLLEYVMNDLAGEIQVQLSGRWYILTLTPKPA